MKDLIAYVREYMREREWLTHRPSDLAKSISIEAAELLEQFQWESLTSEEVLARPEHFAEIKKELADVLIYCLEMAVVLEIDPEIVVREKLTQAAKKYPPELLRSWKNQPAGINKEYLAIKKAYREQEDAK